MSESGWAQRLQKFRSLGRKLASMKYEGCKECLLVFCCLRIHPFTSDRICLQSWFKIFNSNELYVFKLRFHNSIGADICACRGVLLLAACNRRSTHAIATEMSDKLRGRLATTHLSFARHADARRGAHLQATLNRAT